LAQVIDREKDERSQPIGEGKASTIIVAYILFNVTVADMNNTCRVEGKKERWASLHRREEKTGPEAVQGRGK